MPVPEILAHPGRSNSKTRTCISSTDVLGSEAAPQFLESVPNRIYLSDLDLPSAAGEPLPLAKAEIAAIRRLEPKRELYLQRRAVGARIAARRIAVPSGCVNRAALASAFPRFDRHWIPAAAAGTFRIRGNPADPGPLAAFRAVPRPATACTIYPGPLGAPRHLPAHSDRCFAGSCLFRATPAFRLVLSVALDRRPDAPGLLGHAASGHDVLVPAHSRFRRAAIPRARRALRTRTLSAGAHFGQRDGTGPLDATANSAAGGLAAEAGRAGGRSVRTRSPRSGGAQATAAGFPSGVIAPILGP